MKGNYQNGKIYKIEPIVDHEENEVYYGSTTQLFCKRTDTHRSGYKRWKEGKYKMNTVFNLFEKFGMENCKIYLVEKYACDSREELEAREGEIIKANKCVNKCVAGRTRKEYYEDKRETLLEKQKEYYETNKKHIKEKRKQYYEMKNENIKQYYEKNKQTISEKKNEKFTCECGSTCRKSDKSQHRKSKKHQKYLNSLN